MGTELTITKEDVLATALVPPGWYPAECNTYQEKAATTDGSLNRNFGFLIVDGEFTGVKLRTTFNEKFAPLLKPFVESVGGQFQVGEKMDLETVAKQKMRMNIHVKRGEYNGNPTNEIDGFRKL